MSTQKRIERLESQMPESEIEQESITVNAGDYSLKVPVSLLPTIEKIYGHE